MADFSLTSIFVVPVTQQALPSAGSTQDLTAGQVGIFLNTYAVANAGNIAAAPYFYIAQGRQNTYLQGSKRSDKIKGCPTAVCDSNVLEKYKVVGCGTPINQISQIGDWNVYCEDVVTVTIRAHSSYIDSLFFNGLTRSVTVNAPCCECGGDPCDTVDVDALIDLIMEKFTGYEVTDGVIDWTTPINPALPDNNTPGHIDFNTFFTFSKVGSGDTAKLQIEGKALTSYGQPCDVAAFPHEYDRLWFSTFVYEGPATTADFIVADACNVVAESSVIQRSTYATGTSEEIAQLEKNFHSYQTGYMKPLYRMAGYNNTFESWVNDGTVYDTFYIKFNNYDRGVYNWGEYEKIDNIVIIAAPTGTDISSEIKEVLDAALGTVSVDNECVTSTTTVERTTTTTTLPL